MEHFVKPSYGKIYHFCHTKQGICVSNGTAEYQVVLPDGEDDFDVTVDDNDGIHMVCQNISGDIIYITKNEDKWESHILMQSRSRKSSKKNFSVQRAGNLLNIIYLLEYKNSYVITHQIIENGNRTPDVLDYTNGEFSVAKDSCNNIYVLYYSLTYKRTGYMIYTWSKKEWTEFIPLNIDGIVTQPHILIDRCDNLHITGCLNSEIIYYQDVLHSFGKGENPIILEKESLHLLWENSADQKIRAVCSTDFGKSFSTPTEFMAGRFSTPKIYAISYTRYESSCNANRCYGYTSDGTVKFFLTPDFFNISRIPPRPKETSLSSEIKQFRQKLNAEPQSEKSIITMLEKLSVKLDVLLNETKSIKILLTNQKNEHIIKSDLRLDE